MGCGAGALRAQGPAGRYAADSGSSELLADAGRTTAISSACEAEAAEDGAGAKGDRVVTFCSEVSKHSKDPSIIAGGSSGSTAAWKGDWSALNADIPFGRTVTQEDKLATVKEVYIFRFLTQSQQWMVVDSLVPRFFHKGACITRQHEIGNTFFIIMQGDVRVVISGIKVRSMGKNAYFGERALLFDEPRTATVEAEGDVDLLCLEKQDFMEIVPGLLHKQLMYRIQLQDTSVKLEDLHKVQEIGRGGGGVVDLVEHHATAARYALKRVTKHNDGSIPRDVKREMDLLAMNDHPFVIYLVKTFDSPKHAYMLTELVPGGELYDAIRAMPLLLTRAEAQFYTGSIVLAMEALHARRIIYRDLKPQNVMIDMQGYVKLIDFGIATKLAPGQTKTYTIAGTPHYMSPEAMRGMGYGCSADVWAIGIILYELVCGCVPFGEEYESPDQIFSVVLAGEWSFPDFYKDQAGVKLIGDLLVMNPEKRYGCGREGISEVKRSEYFNRDDCRNDLFEDLLGRELEAPVVPNTETYHSEVASSRPLTKHSRAPSVNSSFMSSSSEEGCGERMTTEEVFDEPDAKQQQKSPSSQSAFDNKDGNQSRSSSKQACVYYKDTSSPRE
eukprot:TRINITY_DN5192_c0_g1_i1.p1 TRINITY_DN5192_c0_g1~~TRINITY_DN5192_c0_g1_i1.p1  ORF type:complete len:613 (-),score=170.88 TRINITY_DN5192_c0_g1_i1:200-2038(-)